MPRPVRSLHRLAAALVLAAPHLAATALGAGCPCGSAADDRTAAAAGLVREWIVQLPFNSATGRLEHVVVGDGIVAAQSTGGSVHAIRSASSGAVGPRAGTVAWSRAIGDVTGHAWPPAVGSRLVVVATEMDVHAIDRDSGAMLWERSTTTTTAGAAAQAGAWVYVPLQTHRMLRLPVDPLVQPAVEPAPEVKPASARRSGGAPAEPPTAPESLEPLSIDLGGALDTWPVVMAGGVLWSTDVGLVGLERTPLGWIRHALPESSPPSWVRRSALALAGPPTVRDSEIFIATTAGYIARIDINAKNRPGLRTAWRSPLPEQASSAPLVSSETLVVALGPAGIAAFSADDGRELWRTDLVGTPVAIAGRRAWVLDNVGRLSALDLGTGSRRQSLNLGCFTLPVVNTLTERIVLASPEGLVASLAPPAAPAAPAKRRPVSDGDRPPAEPAPEDPDATPR
ncbi:MAG: PQQ-binding-like beta-propeller repeat protein [Planctomycetaceae bacterium]